MRSSPLWATMKEISSQKKDKNAHFYFKENESLAIKSLSLSKREKETIERSNKRKGSKRSYCFPFPFWYWKREIMQEINSWPTAAEPHEEALRVQLLSGQEFIFFLIHHPDGKIETVRRFFFPFLLLEASVSISVMDWWSKENGGPSGSCYLQPSTLFFSFSLICRRLKNDPDHRAHLSLLSLSQEACASAQPIASWKGKRRQGKDSFQKINFFFICGQFLEGISLSADLERNDFWKGIVGHPSFS